eukprot:scaffold848_cov120-Amphora_coffeaeformis.AAC.4
MEQLWSAVMAGVTVFGGKKQTLAAQKEEVLERQEETIKLLLSRAFTAKDPQKVSDPRKEMADLEKKMLGYVEQLDARADYLDKKVEDYARNFEAIVEKLEKVEGRIDSTAEGVLAEVLGQLQLGGILPVKKQSDDIVPTVVPFEVATPTVVERKSVVFGEMLRQDLSVEDGQKFFDLLDSSQPIVPGFVDGLDFGTLRDEV